MKSVSVKNAIIEADASLEQSGSEESRLEAEVLLCHVLGIDRTQLLIGMEENISYEKKERFDRLVKRRIDREPIAYITGHKEFFGIEFTVTRDTLIPRPETEVLVENVIKLVRSRESEELVVADVGTGCGAIAVAIAVHCPNVALIATDICSSAMEIAAQNAAKVGVSDRTRFVQCDLLQSLTEPVDIIVANLPYICESDMNTLSDDVLMYEPALALSGGVDGLDYINRLVVQACSILCSGGAILLEVGPDQRVSIEKVVDQFLPGASIEILCDLAGKERVVCVETEKIKSGNTPHS